MPRMQNTLTDADGYFADPDTRILLDALFVDRDTEPDDDWQDRGLCAEVDPDLFFPEKGGSVREAKRVCARCPVRVECLEEALANDERFGVWGGLSETDRRRLRRRVAA